MKTLIASIFALLSAQAAFAAPAVSYNCVGKNAVTNKSIVFNLVYSEWEASEGYTYQAVEVLKEGFEMLKEPKVLFLNATKACDNNQGAIGMPDFKMTPTKQGAVGDYLVRFKLSCGSEYKFDVKGVCFFE